MPDWHAESMPATCSLHICIGNANLTKRTGQSSPQSEGEPATALRRGEAISINTERKVRRSSCNTVERGYPTDMQN